MKDNSLKFEIRKARENAPCLTPNQSFGQQRRKSGSTRLDEIAFHQRMNANPVVTGSMEPAPKYTGLNNPCRTLGRLIHCVKPIDGFRYKKKRPPCLPILRRRDLRQSNPS